MAIWRRAVLVTGLCGLLLSGCVGTTVFSTSYDGPVDPALARTWRLGDVAVAVPDDLTVSEAHVFEPDADIVWREDPIGDRRAQVRKIMTDAVRRGAPGLSGSVPVRFEVTVRRFHALTLEAEALNVAGIGVHNIHFDFAVYDGRSGRQLVAPQRIDATLPALTGTEMIQARIRGESQRSHISNHVAATVAGWLGTGPDQRGSFVRAGR